MPKIIRTITVDVPLPTVYEYLADFAHASEWDPGTESSVPRDAEGPRVGQIYDLIVTWGPRKLPMTYETTTLAENKVIVFTGKGSTTTAVDTLRFSHTGSATSIRYEADIRLKWPYRLFTPFLRSKFDQLGDDACARLTDVLSTLTPQGGDEAQDVTRST